MLSRLSILVATAVAMLAFASPAFAHHQLPNQQTVFDLLFTAGLGYGAVPLAAMSALVMGAVLLVQRRRAQD